MPLALVAPLFLIFNVSWIALYVLVIRRGFLDKTFGIPLVALAVNFSWDVINTFVSPSPDGQAIFNFVFIVLEIVIIYQLLRFWQTEITNMPPAHFYFWSVIALVMSLVLIHAAQVEFQGTGERSGYADTFLSSAFFVAMIYMRRDLGGQSLYIGLLKLVGNASLMLALLLRPWPGTENSVLLPVLYVGIFFFDIAYVVLYVWRARQHDINPRLRF